MFQNDLIKFCEERRYAIATIKRFDFELYVRIKSWSGADVQRTLQDLVDCAKARGFSVLLIED